MDIDCYLGQQLGDRDFRSFPGLHFIRRVPEASSTHMKIRLADLIAESEAYLLEAAEYNAAKEVVQNLPAEDSTSTGTYMPDCQRIQEDSIQGQCANILSCKSYAL